MTHYTPEFETALAMGPVETAQTDRLGYLKRSRLVPLLFVLPTLICGVSWMGNGIPVLTDAGFVLFTVIGIGLCLGEFFNFSRRFGIGGMALFGGYVIWFCHDYLTNWYGKNFEAGIATFKPVIIAKAAFFHCLFIGCAALGLLLPPWRGLTNLSQKLREPGNVSAYFPVVILGTLVGLLPYMLFVQQGFFTGLWLSITGGRGGEGAAWTVGRSGGNVNTSWGGYIVQLMQIGQIAAQLGLFYAVLITRNPFHKAVCWCFFLLQAALAFGTGTRGELAFQCLPVLALLFLKYQAKVAEIGKRFSTRAYFVAGVSSLVIVALIQIQIAFRNTGFAEADFSEVNYTKIEGNPMFSEGLLGWSLIPEVREPFYTEYPGGGLLLPIPITAWNFIIGPIPRALWTSKPFDPVWLWYKSVYTGSSEDQLEGTTVATGLVGDWYFRYGFLGVIQGAILFGWICRNGEAIFQEADGRLIQLVLSIGLTVFAFRSFRGMTFITLYPMLIGTLGLWIIVRIVDKFASGSDTTTQN